MKKNNVNGLFSFRLYVEGLKKVRIVGVISAIVVIALNAIIPIINIVNERPYLSYANPDIAYHKVIDPVGAAAFAPFSLLMLIFAPIFAHAMFSYLNERNKSDFFLSIPQKRECVYITFTASIFTWILGILFATSFVNGILWGISKYHVFNISTMFTVPLVFFVAAVMLVGFMTLAITLTGTNVSNVLIFTLLLLFVRTTGMIFLSCVKELAPVFDEAYSVLRIFDVNFFMPFSLFIDIFNEDILTFSNVPLILYTVAVDILLFVAGLFSYKIRRSEIATKSAPSKVLQHVYRSMVTFPFMLLLFSSILQEGIDLSLQMWLVILIILVYLVFELVTTRKISQAIKSAPLIVVPIAMTLVFAGITFGVANHVMSFSPSENEIESIGLYNNSTYGSLGYENMILNEINSDSPEAVKIVAEGLKNNLSQKEGDYNPNLRTRMVYVKIKTTSDKTVGRILELPSVDYDRLKTLVAITADNREAYLSLPPDDMIGSVYLVGSFVGDLGNLDKDSLWQVFKEDYYSLSDEKKAEFKSLTTNQLEIGLSGMLGGRTFSSRYPVNYEYTPRTIEMLVSYWENKLTQSGGIEGIESCIRNEMAQGVYGEDEIYFYMEGLLGRGFYYDFKSRDVSVFDILDIIKQDASRDGTNLVCCALNDEVFVLRLSDEVVDAILKNQ